MAPKSTTPKRAELISRDPPTTGGTSSAYTLTSNEALPAATPEFNQFVKFVTHRTSAGSATLAIGGGAAYPLLSKDGRAPAFLLMAGKSYEAWFNGRAWVLPFDSSTAAWNQNEATFNRQALAEEYKATDSGRLPLEPTEERYAKALVKAGCPIFDCKSVARMMTLIDEGTVRSVAGAAAHVVENEIPGPHSARPESIQKRLERRYAKYAQKARDLS